MIDHVTLSPTHANFVNSLIIGRKWKLTIDGKLADKPNEYIQILDVNFKKGYRFLDLMI